MTRPCIRAIPSEEEVQRHWRRRGYRQQRFGSWVGGNPCFMWTLQERQKRRQAGKWRQQKAVTVGWCLGATLELDKDQGLFGSLLSTPTTLQHLSSSSHQQPMQLQITCYMLTAVCSIATGQYITIMDHEKRASSRSHWRTNFVFCLNFYLLVCF